MESAWAARPYKLQPPSLAAACDGVTPHTSSPLGPTQGCGEKFYHGLRRPVEKNSDVW